MTSGGPPGEGSVRRAVFRVEGQVQGVGFRPFVHRLANELGLRGAVGNDLRGVTVEAWGTAEALDAFERRVRSDAPALARVERVERTDAPPGPEVGRATAPHGFRIAASGAGEGRRGRVTVDAAVCADCIREMEDPRDRRHRHPLINCTNCGPRYTIVRDLPYDRARTTMADFPMCAACAAEYRDPADRRFHAQPVCCHDCGPRLRLEEVAAGGGPPRVARGPEEVEALVGRVAELVAGGGVVAMKGLGGYHLVCDGTRADAVVRLREVKRRDHKPFALMVPDLAAAEALCELSPAARELLASPVAPIVIAPWRAEAREGAGRPVPAIAPGHERLGLMLPGTPMQHLLARHLPRPLVMTSANLSHDPLVVDDEEARRRLPGVDAFLDHDRPIERAMDDGVVLDPGPHEPPLPLRRARGMAPAPLRLPRGGVSRTPGLCLGADLKNAVAVVRGGEAILSQHVGDLTHHLALRRFRRTVDDLQRLFDVVPRWVAVDLHPDYLSRAAGLELAREAGGRMAVVEVQHHHAHLASLLAEHGRSDAVVGVVCDGVGHGSDGTAWGGEILVGDLRAFERVAWLRPLRLPGGDAAAVETGRCGLSWLVDALGPEAASRHPAARVAVPDGGRRAAILALLERDVRCPPSTGAGRLFDAAAALLGICRHNHHEAMAGQLLESAALRAVARSSGEPWSPVGEGEGAGSGELDHRPLLRELLVRAGAGVPVDELAWLFHDALAAGLAAVAIRVARTRGIGAVGLTGGVFCNAVLTRRVAERIEAAGLRVLRHREVPPNDGGIALGQAAVAGARLGADSSPPPNAV